MNRSHVKPLTYLVEEIVPTCSKGMFVGPTKIPNQIIMFTIFPIVLAYSHILHIN